MKNEGNHDENIKILYSIIRVMQMYGFAVSAICELRGVCGKVRRNYATWQNLWFSIFQKLMFIVAVWNTMPFGISKATRRLSRTFSLVITTGGSWEPSSGSYDAERHSLLDR